jgi:hypothetical protein
VIKKTSRMMAGEKDHSIAGIAYPGLAAEAR